MHNRNNRVRALAAGVAGLCVSLFGVVGHGQNTASGQRFAEPPVHRAARCGRQPGDENHGAVHGRQRSAT